MTKLTQREVDMLKPAAADRVVWDSELSGFGIRIRPSGVKTYVVYYRFEGRQRKVTLGREGQIKAVRARMLAYKLISKSKEGVDGAREKLEARKASTIAELGERFLDEYAPAHLKPSTRAEYRRSVELFITPRLGAIRVRELTRGDVAELHHKMRATPYQANRTLGVLSKMMGLAELWGLRPEGANPCRKVPKFKERRRERFLSTEELTALGKALTQEESNAPFAVAAYRLLILTGCRLREIQTLRWEHVDLKEKVIRLPDSKTGKKTIYLGEDAVRLLSRIDRSDENPYVIVGELPGAHLTDLQRPWRRIRARCGLDDVRIHDLRHTYASIAVTQGQGLPMIGKLLGHTQVQTTARYAHLADDPVRNAAEVIGGSISAALSGRAAGSQAGRQAKKPRPRPFRHGRPAAIHRRSNRSPRAPA